MSNSRVITDYLALDSNVNFSDHFPLVFLKCVISDSLSESRHVSKAAQLHLRWDKGDIWSFYGYTGHKLSPLLAEVEETLSLFN